MHFDASENMKIVNVTCNIFLLHECFGNNGFYIPKAGGFLHPKGPKGDFLHPKGPKGPRVAKILLLDPRDAKIHLLKG